MTANPRQPREDGDWVCCQLGAREHYAVARALEDRHALNHLITDVWLPPGSLLTRLHPRLRDRFHPALQSAHVESWNTAYLAAQTSARFRRLRGWDAILERNAWFQHRLGAWIKDLGPAATRSVRMLFSYSYTAREAFRLARERGWKTMLGQIDPGPVEADIVANEQRAFGAGRTHWAAPPAAYWEAWREECVLADQIVVNSEWSRTALVQAGVPPEKLVVVPLAYETAPGGVPSRAYPQRFDETRRLRVLFLGQVNLRKGLARVLEAARLLADEAVEFWMVGPLELTAGPEANADPNMKWFGPVPRGGVARFYQEADVFLFPTLSDGFGLTQLEAQAHKLPVIATTRCGEVVRDGHNGLVLSEPTGEAIAAALQALLSRPARLAAMSAASGVEPQFSLSSIGEKLLALAGAPTPSNGASN